MAKIMQQNNWKKQKNFLCEDVNVNIYTLKKCAYMEISKKFN